MGALPTELRNQLSKACVAARDAAQKGAESALKGLAVHHHEPHGSMTTDQRTLRNRLRAHGRQLGDTRDKQRGTQTIDRLIHECAYEHWHRMLFARFLVENHLLIEPNSGVAITMEECEELARDAAEDPWALASRFAQRMLPQIFRPDDPVLAVGLPPETRQTLERLLADLPAAVFTADDALGWTYQFWQSAEKDRVNASGEKITGATLPAVTQLFTEHYMVLFLLHNTIGAWHAGRALAQRPELAESAASEQELRDAVALDGCQFEYLRFLREQEEGEEEGSRTGPWRPAAGTFDGWPKRAAELTVLDPCCGSGHFLVEVFFLLVRLRIAEEGSSLDSAIRAVLKENVFALELDARCTQIAAFNLALAAWRMIGKVIDLPNLNIACSGIGPQSTEEHWLKLAEQSPDAWNRLATHAREPIRNGLRNLHRLFSQAPELGSLIDPEALPGDLIAADYETLRPFLETVFRAESGDDDMRERVIAAMGMARAATILVGPVNGYTLITTNVPYLGKGKQSDTLKAFINDCYRDARHDIATVFLARCLNFAHNGGTVGAVTPQHWLSLVSYKKLRIALLTHRTLNVVARLGANAFEAIGGHVVNVALTVLTKTRPVQEAHFVGVDVSCEKGACTKAAALAASGSCQLRAQASQVGNPGSRVMLSDRESGEMLLESVAVVSEGLHTGDYPRFGRYFWELPREQNGWTLQEAASQSDAMCAGKECMLLWRDSAESLLTFVRTRLGSDNVSSWIKGDGVWGSVGIAIGKMAGLRHTLYLGQPFTHGAFVVVPKRSDDLPAIWCYADSGQLSDDARELDQRVAIDRLALAHLPFDSEHWRAVAGERFPNGLQVPAISDPTQWVFSGNPPDTDLALAVGIARLLGYAWPRATGSIVPMFSAIGADIAAQHSDADGIVCFLPVRGEASAADRLRRLLSAVYGDAWSAKRERELLHAAGSEFSRSKAAGSLEDWLVTGATGYGRGSAWRRWRLC